MQTYFVNVLQRISIDALLRRIPHMDNRGKMITARSVFALSLAIVVLALLAPVAANAQVTVTHVRVTLSPAAGATSGSTAIYCDTATPCPTGIQVWNLGGGVALSGGQTLVLTQTGVLAGIGGNFDTSDRVRPTAPTIFPCLNPNQGCNVKIEIDTGSGFVTAFDTSANNPINNFNGDNLQPNHHEEAQWTTAPVFSVASWNLRLGYADNVHGCITPPPAGTITTCFPNPFDGSFGTTKATVFIGAGAAASATCSGNCFDAGALLITGITVPPPLAGRMTGGGSVFTTDGIRVTHGFELHCNKNDLPNNLEINWDGGNNFHLTTLTSVTCIDDPKINPRPPVAPFDTMIGAGVGTCNGLPASITFTLTDAGEPGTKDTATFHITGGCTLDVSNFLDKGNQQAHND
jgi:hypothetical protein